MNLLNLPTEIIGLVIKFSSLKDKISLGLSARAFLEEAKRQTKPKITKYKNTLIKSWHTFDYKSDSFYSEYQETYAKDKLTTREWKNVNGLHRENKPAYIKEQLPLYVEKWFKDGIEHNENGPAEQWYRNGKLSSSDYYKNGKLHNDNGPANINYWLCEGPTGYTDSANRKMAEIWYSNGQKHRDDGPAVINYDLYGNTVYEEFWYDGLGYQGNTYFTENGVQSVRTTYF